VGAYTHGMSVHDRKAHFEFTGESMTDAIHAACERSAVHAGALRIATHCTSVAQFVARFHPFCGERSIFVPYATGEVGTQIVFSFELEDGTTAFRGLGVVTDEFTTKRNRFARPGIAIAVTRLHPNSHGVFANLAARA